MQDAALACCAAHGVAMLPQSGSACTGTHQSDHVIYMMCLVWYKPGTCSSARGFRFCHVVYVYMQRRSQLTEVAGCVQEVLQPNRRLCVPGQKKQKESGRPTQAHPLDSESQVAAPAEVQVLLHLHARFVQR